MEKISEDKKYQKIKSPPLATYKRTKAAQQIDKGNERHNA